MAKTEDTAKKENESMMGKAYRYMDSSPVCRICVSVLAVGSRVCGFTR